MRRVLRVQFRAPDSALAQRGAIVLEDAMRTASLPGADGGRLVLVRRLDLGAIPAGIAPASLALRIEQRYRELGVRAVYGLTSEVQSAATAPAVWFHDETEICAALAARVACGHMPAEWFWSAACPWYRPGISRTETLRRALYAALDAEPGGPPAAAAFCAQLLEAGALREVVLALEPRDGPLLLSRCGFIPSSPEAAHTESRWEQVLRAAVATWGHTDARALWLAAIALIVDRPTRAVSRVTLLCQAHAPNPSAGTRRCGDPGPNHLPRDSGGESSRPEPGFEPESKPPNPHRGLPAASSAEEPVWGGGEFSPTAGVFFLIPVFARLGLPARRDVDAAELLYFIACSDPAAAPHLKQWTRTVRRWLQRRLRLRLAWLIARPGRIAATRTHVDVYFDLRDADPRLRRLGLDFDPGWTPWLGKVVRYHYEPALRAAGTSFSRPVVTS